MSCSIEIRVGARCSNLYKAQVEEVYREIIQKYPHLKFIPFFVETTGDKDQNTSLRTLGTTNFFTKEIDEMVLNGLCDIAIHSAKDLPDPLSEGLELIALTQGVDSSDVLVLRDGETLETLPKFAKIATSSLRREENVAFLKKTVAFVDIRGTIEKRLEQLFDRRIDGVVVAEAALIRLKLTHLNRIILPGEVAKNQGRLAILAKKDNQLMKDIFSTISY